MGFEDFFEQDQHHKQNRYNQPYNSGYHHKQDYYRKEDHHHDHDYDERGYSPGTNLGYYLLKIRSNPKLRMLIIGGFIFILCILIILIIAMMPLLIKLFGYIEKVGFQGILDGIVGFLDKLWKGSGK